MNERIFKRAIGHGGKLSKGPEDIPLANALELLGITQQNESCIITKDSRSTFQRCRSTMEHSSTISTSQGRGLEALWRHRPVEGLAPRSDCRVELRAAIFRRASFSCSSREKRALNGLLHAIASFPCRGSQADSMIGNASTEEKGKDAGQGIGFSSSRASGNESKPSG